MANEDLAKLKIDKSAPIQPRRKGRGVLLWILAGGCVVAILVLWFGGWLRPSVEVRIATVSQAYPSQGFALLNASGYVVPQRKAAVASKTTGRLVWLGVEEGHHVSAGEVIAKLEGEDVAASHEQAAANVQQARSTLESADAELRDATFSFERQRLLFSQGIVARADYDSAEARLTRAKATVTGSRFAIKAAEAVLKGAATAVEYTLIRAPFDGIVLTKNADVGDIITPLGAAANAKAAVVTLADPGSLQVEADVSESNLGRIKIGQPCEIQLDALPDLRFRGVVHMIVPTADRSKATVMTKVRFLDLDSRILPEMSAKVAFLERAVTDAERKPITVVSPDAVVTRNGAAVVFVVVGNVVAKTRIELGARRGDFMEVRSGVKIGDKVVLKPPTTLKDGSRIKSGEP